MAKWRPSEKNCIYVIPDIHGAYDLLILILKQILPLRKSDGGKDILIFLGDYIDRHLDSPKILDLLIQVQDRYPNQTYFLRGNHENMLLKAFNKCIESPTYGIDLEFNFRNWTHNGGLSTIQGYFDRHGLSEDPSAYPRFRLETLIPKDHWEFMQKTLPYLALDKYLFVHGGCDPWKDVSKHELEHLVWDRSLYKSMVKSKEEKDFSHVEWEHTIVCGHSGPNILVHPKYMMLDAGSPDQLLCTELRSMKGIMAKPGYSRLIKIDVNNK